MELVLRYSRANQIEYDHKIEIANQKEWLSIISDPLLTSSVLTPTENRFVIVSNRYGRKHPHERNYSHNDLIIESYKEGCKEIAREISEKYTGAKCLIYAPLRGAYPIWKCISGYLTGITSVVYFPITSSFIFFPKEFNIVKSNGRPASCRYNNTRELKRLIPFLESFDVFLYVDEIVSGGMMRGHIKEMLSLKINDRLPIIAVGLADAFGVRSIANRAAINEYRLNRKLDSFIWKGCKKLITEDQKFLLGIHYVDYNIGPHIVPVLNGDLEYYPEKKMFDKIAFSAPNNNINSWNGFCNSI